MKPLTYAAHFATGALAILCHGCEGSDRDEGAQAGSLGEDCSELSVEACAGRDDCLELFGTPYDAESECFDRDARSAVACVSIDSGGGAPSGAVSPDGLCYFFGSTLRPEGWDREARWCTTLADQPESLTYCDSEGGVDGPCADHEQAFVSFLEGNRACEADTDCVEVHGNCGPDPDHCSGSYYLHESHDSAEYEVLGLKMTACSDRCGGCAQAGPPGACIEGRCEAGEYPPAN